MLEFHIKSRSQDKRYYGTIYKIEHFDDGSWYCGCPDFLWRARDKCKHIRKIIDRLHEIAPYINIQ